MAYSADDGFFQLANVKKTCSQKTLLVKSIGLAIKQRKINAIPQHIGSEKATMLMTLVAYKNTSDVFAQQRYQAGLSTRAWFLFTVNAAAIHLMRSSVMACLLFAFVTTLDRIVPVLFPVGPEQGTIPRLMLSGLREQINPAILLVTTLPVVVSIIFLAIPEALRRRSGRIRYGGEAPQN